MSFRSRLSFLLCATLLGGTWWVTTTGEGAAADDKDAKNSKKEDKKPLAPAGREEQLQKFMRKKLEASNKILEGIVTDNSAIVVEGAKSLEEMCDAEEWRVSKDVLYRQFSDEYQRATGRLADAAKKGDMDKSLVRWMDVTMKCVSCHTFVREHLMADKK